jgi:DNA-binding beta-propeller fold protein YncE
MIAAGAGTLAAASGCERAARADAGTLELVWGDRGNRPGHLQRPRAIAADDHDRLFIADMTDRIQVFSTDGAFLHHWRLPAFNVDGPTGVSIDNAGNVMVADTHFYRILIFTPDGEPVATIGGVQGAEPGQFGYVREVVQDASGYLITCEYGWADRIQVLDPDHRFVAHWGQYGTEPGQFRRPESLALDGQGRLFVADSCNHRIQVFETNGKLLGVWGGQGAALGQLSYPYDIAFGGDGNLYVCEWGNHRVQKFTPDGKSLGAWGRAGRDRGQLNFPWALAVDQHGRIHLADSSNHRVQRIVM